MHVLLKRQMLYTSQEFILLMCVRQHQGVFVYRLRIERQRGLHSELMCRCRRLSPLFVGSATSRVERWVEVFD